MASVSTKILAYLGQEISANPSRLTVRVRGLKSRARFHR
jgi:hypothetical protein